MNNDRETVDKLKAVCSFFYAMDGDGFCTDISFYDKDYVFEGTLRKHPQKNEIIKLVAGFERLRYLDLRKCKLKTLPEMVSRGIRHLDLSSNDLDAVPGWLMDQPLEYLNLGANNLTDVPDLTGMPLTTLKIHKNKISRVPKTGEQIKTLNLFLNPLNGIPDEVINKQKLEVLTFGGTGTGKLPSFSLPNLRWLTLAVNHFTELPADICFLNKLEGLILPKNRIESLPKLIGDMNLKTVSLYSNNLTSLPDSFFALKLRKLSLAKNPISRPDLIAERFSGIEFFEV